VWRRVSSLKSAHPRHHDLQVDPSPTPSTRQTAARPFARWRPIPVHHLPRLHPGHRPASSQMEVRSFSYLLLYYFARSVCFETYICHSRSLWSLSNTAIRPSVCPGPRRAAAVGCRHAGCLQLRHVRTVDPSADGRRSAASRTAIGGGGISSRRTRGDNLSLIKTSF